MDYKESLALENFEQISTEGLEGIGELQLSEFEKGAINDHVNFNEQEANIIEAYDREVKNFLPNIQTPVHLSLMNGYNDKWSEFVIKIDAHFLESISDKEQVESIAQYLSEVEEIRFEQWKDLTIDQMVSILDSMETVIAKIEHRLPAQISAEYLGDKCFGQQCGLHIKINTHILEESAQSPEILREVLTTFIHEGRHMYQEYNINVRMVHESPSEVNSWRENLYELGYRSGEPIEIPLFGPIAYTNEQLMADGERLYYYQPVEIDARDMASDVMIRYDEIISNSTYEADTSLKGLSERLSEIQENIKGYENILADSSDLANEISFKGVNDKAWNMKKAQENREWAEWYTKKAEAAIERGDLSTANDYLKRAALAEGRADDYIKAAQLSTK